MDYIGYDVDFKKYYKTDDNGDYILDSNGNKIVKQLDLASLNQYPQLVAIPRIEVGDRLGSRLVKINQMYY